MAETKHLRDMRIDKVSLVDRGANDRRFAVLKQARPADEVEHVDDERTLLQKAADAINALLTPVPADDAPEADITALVQSVEDINKAGRKISGTRLAAIKQAMTTLYDIVDEVEPGWWTPPGGNISKESPDMTEDTKVEEPTVDDKVAEAIEKALSSDAFAERMGKAIAAAMPQPEPEKVDKADDKPADDEVTLDTVAEAVVELSKRMDGMGRSTRQSIDAQDGEPVRKSALTGILQ